MSSVSSHLIVLCSAVYRTIELTDGWDGAIITNELYFSTFFFYDKGLLELIIIIRRLGWRDDRPCDLHC